MDVLLINPKHGGLFPWGLLSLGSYLTKQVGMEVMLIDASVEGIEDTLQKIREHLPKTPLVGIGAMSSDTPFIKTIADMVKQEKPSCKVIVGGPHATLCPEQLAKYHHIDFVSYHEGEATVATLCQEIRKNKPDLSQVPGLLFQTETNEFIRTPGQTVPFYDINYDLLSPKVRATFSDTIQVLTGRGCSYKCTFCYNVVSGYKWRGRPVADFIQEIQILVKNFDPKNIFFRDELFFIDRERILQFITHYKKNNFHFNWWASVRASDFRDQFVDDPLMKQLVEIGCRQLRIGVESGSEKTLKFIKKGIRVSHVHNTIKRLAPHPKVELMAGFMIGLPTEQYRDYQDTLNLIGWMVRHGSNITIKGPYQYRVYPGGELFDQITKEYPHFSLPNSLEEWANRYQSHQGSNASEYDRNIEYPWVPSEHQYLVKNAFQMYQIAYQSNLSIKGIKKILLWPCKISIRLRFRIGWYKNLWDVRLADWIYRFSLYHTLSHSPLLPILEKQLWYQKSKKSKFFAWLRDKIS
ncbi:MAG: B12-binding domain-containing radical SAM protein [Magnetococcus sp. DMHC-6]